MISFKTAFVNIAILYLLLKLVLRKRIAFPLMKTYFQYLYSQEDGV